MDRYFLDVTTGEGRHIDEVGIIAGSRSDLAKAVRRLLVDVAEEELLDDHATISVQVRDETGRPTSVATLTLHNHWIE